MKKRNIAILLLLLLVAAIFYFSNAPARAQVEYDLYLPLVKQGVCAACGSRPTPTPQRHPWGEAVIPTATSTATETAVPLPISPDTYELQCPGLLEITVPPVTCEVTD